MTIFWQILFDFPDIYKKCSAPAAWGSKVCSQLHDAVFSSNNAFYHFRRLWLIIMSVASFSIAILIHLKSKEEVVFYFSF